MPGACTRDKRQRQPSTGTFKYAVGRWMEVDEGMMMMRTGIRVHVETNLKSRRDV